jgi:hypothetical protein
VVRSSALPLFACSTSAEESIWIFEDGWLVQDPTSFCWDRADGRTDRETTRAAFCHFACEGEKRHSTAVRSLSLPLARAVTESNGSGFAWRLQPYGTVPIYPSQPFSGFRLCFQTRILKTFGSCITLPSYENGTDATGYMIIPYSTLMYFFRIRDQIRVVKIQDGYRTGPGNNPDG